MTKIPTEESPHASETDVSPKKQRLWPIYWVIAATIALVAVVWRLNHRGAATGGGPGGGMGGRRSISLGAMGPMPVVIRAAQKSDIDLYLNELGTVTPLATVTVQTQISGQLMQVAFTEGQDVKRGDLLILIDPRPYEVALEQARGQLLQAQSQQKEAQIDLERYEALAQQDSIAKQQVDDQRALVSQYEGAVAADQAAIHSAELNLVYCHITAPVDGRVGLRQVDPGNYVTPGAANGLVVLTQLKPITVIFTLPEDNIPQVAARLRAGAKLPVEAYDRAQTRKLATGILAAIDSQIDTTTGTLRLRAIFANDDESLFPNQFVNVRLLVDTDRGATVIPTSAIERGQQGTFVYVVNEDSTVSARPVTLGPSEGERVGVLSGLALGERVVVDGADRLRDGARVIIQSPGADHGKGGPGNADGPAGGNHRRSSPKTGAE